MMKDIGPFDYIKMLSNTKQVPIFDEYFEKTYSQYLTNQFFSFYFDTASIANELNGINIPNKNHFMFFHIMISKASRWSKWHKQGETKKIEEIIMDAYNYNRQRAKIAISLLTPKQINTLKLTIRHGGVQ